MSKENRVSDERLAKVLGGHTLEQVAAKILRRYEDDVPVVKQFLRDGEDLILVSYAKALRSKPVAGVEVKPDFYGVWSGKIHIGTWADEKTAREVASEYDSPSVVPLYASPQPEVVITEEMVERAYEAFVAACEWSDWDESEVRGYLRATLTAALKEA